LECLPGCAKKVGIPAEEILRKSSAKPQFLGDGFLSCWGEQRMSERERGHVDGLRFRPGTRLGSYEVLSFIGAGGMGEVYRARDPRLGREVAIKTLHASMSGDAERLRRFEQEARAAGALNHPNILAIHDIGQEGGVPYLVSELLVGETLRQRLAGGAIPTSKAVGYAIQVARGMAAAHERGIFHRDLKPENLFLTSDGVVKILDFGLAKLSQPEEAAGEGSAGLTEGRPTEPGTILGTVGYMSPEQVRGLATDQRSDIFSFGAIVYEMLSGRRAFGRETAVETMNAILKEEPPEITLAGSLPPALGRIVAHCLEKRPEERFQSARDVAFALEGISTTSTDSARETTVAKAGGPGWRVRWRWAIALSLVGLVAGAAIWSLLQTPQARPILRSVIPLSPAEEFIIYNGTGVALSPDGTRLVYAAWRESRGQLDVRPLDRMEAQPIPGTEGGYGAFFSTDGRWIGFFAGENLKKVSLSGGAPLTLCSAGGPRGASWGSDDMIIFAPSARGGLWKVSALGGAPQVLTALSVEQGERTHRWPEILPGGKAVLFTMGKADITWFDDARIEVLRLDTGERRTLIEGGMNARYIPTGHLVYARAGSLLAAPFDLGRLEVTGSPTPVLEDVRTSPGFGGGGFSLSREGTLVYVPGGPPNLDRRIVWVDRNGRQGQPVIENVRGFAPRISPEGQRVAVNMEGATNHVWVQDFSRGTLTRLTFAWSNEVPIWTPDGKRLAFSSDADNPVPNLYWQAADGSQPAERLTTSQNEQRPGSFSPDGKVLAFSELRPSTGWDIWMLDIEGERKARPFLSQPFNEYQPMFSPDGRWLAYQSNQSGRAEIYVQPFPGPGAKHQISAEGGWQPTWARHGRELFYRNGDKMMAVAVTTGPGFEASKPRVLFEIPRFEDYDVAPDGRFLMTQSEPRSPPRQLNLVLNWAEEVKRRVPRGTN